jgi:hypothetical protein
MGVSEAFRKNAQQCLTRAQAAPSLESRAHWLVMGRLWFDLAVHAKEHEIPGSALLNDMAQLWATLVGELGERMNGRPPSPVPFPTSASGIPASVPLVPTLQPSALSGLPASANSVAANGRAVARQDA